MVLTFKLADDVVSSLRNVLLSRGFEEFIEHYHVHNSWNFQWKTTRYSDLESIGPESVASSQTNGRIQQRQKINHFQKTTGICRKDTLARNLRRMKKTYGNIYNYSPQTFILPREAKEFEAEFEAEQKLNSSGETVWICKPSSSSQGLARFSSQKYDPSDMNNLFSHLTNASINKDSPDLFTEKDVIGSGCKWTMARWFDYLESVGVNPYIVWERIKDIAILTLLPIVPEVPDNTRCFELLGFDIMLDDQYKPWIIEVNASPAIAISGLQDTTVKIPLLNDLLEAIGFPMADSLAQATNTDNLLPPNHPSFDPQAQQKAIDATVAAAQVAAALAANGGAASSTTASTTAASNSSSTSAASVVLNTAGRSKDKIQRVPRIVKMQTQQGRKTLETRTASSSRTTTNSTSTTSASPLKSTDTDIKAPLRSPSHSPPPPPQPRRSPNGSPSRIPILRQSMGEPSSASVAAASDVTSQPQQPTSTNTPSSASITAATQLARQRSLAKKRISSATATITTTNANSSANSVKPQSTRIKSTNSTTASASLSSSSSASTAANFISTGAAPLLIGDFERIFPFDDVTAAASDSIATAAVLRGGTKTAAPLPVLFSQFAKTTISSLKARIHARDKLIAEREKARFRKVDLPLRFAFTETSLAPSPWTPEAIDAAVQRAKEAAKKERARCGIPEPVPAASGSSSQAAAEEKKPTLVDESLQLERALSYI